MPAAQTRFMTAALVVAAVGTTALFGGGLPSREPPSQPQEKAKEPATELAKTAPVVIGTKPTWKWTALSVPDVCDLQREQPEDSMKCLEKECTAVVEESHNTKRPLFPPSPASIQDSHVIYHNVPGVG